jgi:hypothetical protein
MSHRFVWVDIPVRELERAIAFYSAVLACAVTREGGPGFTFGVLAHEGSDIAGCLVPATKDNAPSTRGPLVYLNVDRRIAEAELAVVAHGGRVLQPTQPIGPHGYRAIVVDSEGNRVALHSMMR